MKNNSIVPSEECLRHRGENLSFQLQIWCQATKPMMIVPEPEEFGWEHGSNGLQLQPDSKKNLQESELIYQTLMKKCKCRKSQCKDGRCGCFRDPHVTACTSFCECFNCAYNTESAKHDEIGSSKSSSENDSEDDVDGVNPEEYLLKNFVFENTSAYLFLSVHFIALLFHDFLNVETYTCFAVVINTKNGNDFFLFLSLFEQVKQKQ